MAAPKQFIGGGKKPPNRGNNRFNNRRQGDDHRLNERIRCPEVRCSGPHGEKLGVISTHEALDCAKKLGLDLIEIAPNANPPVCIIQDYGKFLYEERKKQKQSKQAAVKLKEVKLRPNIDENDLYMKVRRAEMFLFNGNKVKVTLQFRMHELEHSERGFEVVQRLTGALKHIASLDSEPKLMGRSITTMLSPVPQNKRKLFHNAEPVDDEDLADDEDFDETED